MLYKLVYYPKQINADEAISAFQYDASKFTNDIELKFVKERFYCPKHPDIIVWYKIDNSIRAFIKADSLKEAINKLYNLLYEIGGILND